jgi:lipoprotein NlpD
MKPRYAHALIALAALSTAACTTISLREVPIVDKSDRRAAGSSPSAAPAAAPSPAPLTREAKDGTYVVQRGDTLYSIALAFGQDWRDIARWNQLADPTKLGVRQALRVAPATDTAATTAASPVVVAGSIESRPLEAPGAAQAPQASVPPVAPPASPTPPPTIASAPASAPSPSPSPTPTPAPAKPAAPVLDPSSPWAWPANGKVIEPFNETRNKGIDIGGKEGDAVLAANDGEVVYVGNNLRGYGNLVILKHTDDFVSAYAHNKEVLVQQGQAVKRGQRIAQLGATDADMPKLHFEIRRQGKPVDPVKYLPARP